jgi:hypothetical protein
MRFEQSNRISYHQPSWKIVIPNEAKLNEESPPDQADNQEIKNQKQSEINPPLEHA